MANVSDIHAEYHTEPYVKLRWSIITDTSMTAWDRLVYAALVHYQGGREYAFPGIRRIALDIGCSELTVKRAIKRLRLAGRISVQRRGLRQSNRYVVPDADSDTSGSNKMILPEVSEVTPSITYSSRNHRKRSTPPLRSGASDSARLAQGSFLEQPGTDVVNTSKVPRRDFSHMNTPDPRKEAKKQKDPLKQAKIASFQDEVKRLTGKYAAITGQAASVINQCRLPGEEQGRAYGEAMLGRWGDRWLQANLSVANVINRIDVWRRGNGGTRIDSDAKHDAGGPEAGADPGDGPGRIGAAVSTTQDPRWTQYNRTVRRDA